VNWRRFSFNRECWVLLVGPPLDYRFTEDLNGVFSDIGKLLLWEKYEANLGRIIAKVRVSDLEDIPKSIRFTDGDRPDSESWTFSVEILQEEMLGGGPADEDPLPDEGMDPHPLPGNVIQNEPFFPHVDQQQNNVEEDDEGWGHWAMGNNINNGNANVHDQNAGLNNLLVAMEVEEIEENLDDLPMPDGNNGLTISISSSKGESSNNDDVLLPPLAEAQQHLEQIPNDQQLVLGQNLIGVGLMNIIQAYQEEEEDVVLNAASPVNGNDFMLEDVNLMEPNEAHLQIGMARTFFFPVQDQTSLCQSFSEEGLQLWEKYFAPHIDYGLTGNNKDLQIPVSWFNFITLMLVTPERFDWTVNS
jgi:hypothetical protein